MVRTFTQLAGAGARGAMAEHMALLRSSTTDCGAAGYAKYLMGAAFREMGS